MTTTHPFSHQVEAHRANRNLVETVCAPLVAANKGEELLALWYAVAQDNGFEDGDCEDSGRSRRDALCSLIEGWLHDLNIYK